MRFAVRRLLGLALCLLGPVLTSHPAHATGVTAYEGGLWFDGTTFVEATWYSVNGVLRSDPGGAVDRQVDLAGKFVVPPFAEAHNHHFADGMDVAEQNEDYLRQGIFYVKNPNNPRAFTDPLRGQVNSSETVEVIWSNGCLTATGGHPVQIYASMADHFPKVDGKPMVMDGEAYFVVDTATDLERRWPDVLTGKPDFIKVILEHSEAYEARKNDKTFYGKRGLDPELVPEIVDRAHAAGLPVAAHVNTAADFRAAVSAGVDEVNHLPLERLEQRDAVAAAGAGVTVVTTTLSHRPTGHVPDLDAVHRHNLGLLHRAGVTLALGTDDGNLTVRDEYENLQRLNVFDAPTLLRMWTVNTARAVFPDRDLGTLEEGKPASFLTLDSNPLESATAHREISMRVKDGHELTVPEKAPELPSINEALRAPLMRGSIDDAIAEYYRLRKNEPDAYDFSEQQLNGLGYMLMNHGQEAKARAMLELNCEMFPKSANAYDSLAEALEKMGDKESAAESYRRVLELLPGSHYDAKFKEHLENRARTRLAEL